MSEILAKSPAADWRRLDPRNVLYMDIGAGRIVIELAPDFAPRHVENIRMLVRARYFDGLSIHRSHDNYVVQWGDPDEKRELGLAAKTLEPEFTRPAIIGSAPRLLDRNITVVGRVVQGIDKLSVLPRGSGPLGFYERPEQRTPIASVRLAADVPPAERVELEALRTDSGTFRQLVEARRFRRDDWYKVPAGHVDVCNVPLPTRNAKPQER